jgi:hypothetical protein
MPAGKWLVHISLLELGTGQAAPVRGSPFTVNASDPWVRKAVAGDAPLAKRKGASLAALGADLLLYGGVMGAGREWQASRSMLALTMLPHGCWG